MKRSLFSPLNIIIVVAIAAAAWIYIKHVHKNKAEHVATEHIAAAEPVVTHEEDHAEAHEEAHTEAEETK